MISSQNVVNTHFMLLQVKLLGFDHNFAFYHIVQGSHHNTLGKLNNSKSLFSKSVVVTLV